MESSVDDSKLFTKQMRKATRDIHSVSDALVNAKLAFALSDNSVWAEGLLVFYEIFRFLEEAMQRHKDTLLGDMYVEGIERTKAFEEDLKYYLGENWTTNYEVRDSVSKYLLHLWKLEESDPILLIAYVYHLYMGLLSGGQILRKKRLVTSKFNPFHSKSNGGNAITDFGEKSIYSLKKSLVEKTNDIAKSLSEEMKQRIINEGRTVFELNNQIIRSIKGAKVVFLQKLCIFLFILTVASSFYLYFF